MTPKAFLKRFMAWMSYECDGRVPAVVVMKGGQVVYDPHRIREDEARQYRRALTADCTCPRCHGKLN